MVDFTAAPNVPGLKPSERAFTLPTGETFVVRATRLDPTPEGLTVNVKVVAYQADPATGNVVSANGVPVRIPAFVRAISLSALGSGDVTIEGEIADETAKAAERFKNHLVAMQAWQRVPPET